MTVESSSFEHTVGIQRWERILSWVSRAFVWGLMFAILYLLRSFFLLIFLTFVFAYIQSRTVERLAAYVDNYVIRAVLAGLIFLGGIVAVCAYLLPSVGEQAKVFVANYPSYFHAFDAQIVKLADYHPVIGSLLPMTPAQAEAIKTGHGWSMEESYLALILQELVGVDDSGGKSSLKSSMEALGNVGGRLLAITSAFLLSVLFSFLIVLDLPRLSLAVRSLEQTKVRFIYTEVAQGIYDFASMLGRALEAQFFIALLNTALTATGLWLLGLASKTSFLSMIVFLCSFIPIAGVFISSVPICLVALQAGGLSVMVLAVLMVTVVHLVEAYILNPRIYGHHLHMNPVLVLMVLTVGGKLFGVWGLVLGLPACRYFFGQAIRFQKADGPD